MQEEIRVKRTLFDVDSLKDVRLLNNMVICRRLTDNMKKRTSGGVFLVSEWTNKNQELANYADRVYEVIVPPKTLSFVNMHNRTAQFPCPMRWKTSIDIQEGDTVWVGYMAVVEGYGFTVKGKDEYMMFHYSDLKAAKRDNHFFTLNGFVATIPPKTTKLTSSVLDLSPTERRDIKKGIVVGVGSKNEAYVKTIQNGSEVTGISWVDLDGDQEIQVGDVVWKDDQRFDYKLENDLFKVLEDDVWVIQRRYIGAILS